MKKTSYIFASFGVLFSITSLAEYKVKQINSSTATVVLESEKIPVQVPKDLAITLSDGDQCIGKVISIQERIVLTDVKNCPNRGKIRLGQLATESIEIAPNEMLRQQIQPVQAEQQAATSPTGETAKKTKKEFNVDDGEPHYAFKFHYAIAPIVTFSSVTVGSTSGKANVGMTNGLGFKLEYGFYNRKYWNLVAGAGFDFDRSTSSEEIVLTTGSAPTNGPHLKLSSLNLYLSINYPLDSFYLNGSMIFVMPNVSFDNARSYSGKGGYGYEAELGYMISQRWAACGSYRQFQLSGTARAMSTNDYSFDNGWLSDFLVGARYIFR